jgi:hypothetical protein
MLASGPFYAEWRGSKLDKEAANNKRHRRPQFVE